MVAWIKEKASLAVTLNKKKGVGGWSHKGVRGRAGDCSGIPLLLKKSGELVFAFLGGGGRELCKSLGVGSEKGNLRIVAGGKGNINDKARFNEEG